MGVDLLFNVLPIVCGGYVFFVMYNFVFIQFCNHLKDEEKAGCFDFITL